MNGQNSQTPPALTVAICTFRRADLLPTTLNSLAAIEKPVLDWDVLVVDNGCEDSVQQIVADFAGKLPIRYVAESAVGIARARNRAVNSITTPIILFADDDVLFDRDWLVNMVRTIQAHPDCDFWGGRIEPVWRIPRPEWFDVERCPSLGDSVVRYDIGSQPHYWDPAKDPPFYTANLALRVEAVRKAGMFDVTLGHSGAKRGSGEDSWMIKTISLSGGKGWYAADALLQHPVEAKRLTRPYARAFAWRQGRISVEMLRRQEAIKQQVVKAKTVRTPRWLYRMALGKTVAGLGTWISGMFRGNPGVAFAGQFEALFNFSKLWHALLGTSSR